MPLLHSGVTICLTGRPNAGKSSLLNILKGADVVIVSEEEGTTRDVVTVDLDLDGEQRSGSTLRQSEAVAR